MSTVVNMHKAKSDLSRLVAQALAGEEVVITRSGKAVVRLVPVRQERAPGLARGKVLLTNQFDTPLPEEVLRTFEST